MGGMGDAAGQLGQATGVTNLVQGISDLFTGGGGAPQAGAPGAPQSLDFMGPPAPGPSGLPGQEMVGPPSPYHSPNFMQGFVQGFTGQTPGAGTDTPLSAGGAVGGGLGQLFNAIEQLRQGGASGLVKEAAGPIVQGIGRKLMGPEMAPGYQQAQAPQSGLIHKIIAAYTGGILDSPKMGGL
jgi:hypothetical protein